MYHARSGDVVTDPMDVIRMSLFGQLFEQLKPLPARSLRVFTNGRNSAPQPWSVEYRQEAGMDAGRWFTLRWHRTVSSRHLRVVCFDC